MTASSASAADIQVSYRVDAKLLKKNTPAGTPLSFQLYADSTCATSAGAPQVANVEAVALIEQPRLIKVKRGPTPPSVAEIRYTLTGITPLPAFYATVSGTGITPVGAACQLQLASVGGTEPPTCPSDSVKSGDVCVDKYEASLWDIPPGSTTVIQHIKDGTVTRSELMGVGATQVSAAGGAPAYDCSPVIPGTFPIDGNYTAPLYAVSIANVIPTACVSAFQASTACGLSTKRLLTNIEWVAAATGTADPDTDNGTTDCNTGSPGTPTNDPSNTGGRSSCVSTTGGFDMVGNVYEWTAGDFSTTWIRGGSWDDGTGASVSYASQSGPYVSFSSFGFRCAR